MKYIDGKANNQGLVELKITASSTRKPDQN